MTVDPEDASILQAEPFTERQRFYLKHRQQIEEWHALGGEARSAVDRYLSSLVIPLQALGDEMDLVCHQGDVRKYRQLYLSRPEHLRVEDRPILSVCFGWKPNYVVLDAADAMPYVAVQVAKGAPGAEAVREEFMDRCRQRREELGFRHTDEWPVWTWVQATGEYWLDLEVYTASVVEAVGLFLKEFQPAIDEVLAH